MVSHCVTSYFIMTDDSPGSPMSKSLGDSTDGSIEQNSVSVEELHVETSECSSGICDQLDISRSDYHQGW